VCAISEKQNERGIKTARKALGKYVAQNEIQFIISG
jgi:hypothetical protein